MSGIGPPATALLLVDMQNDFLHPGGACARGGVGAAEIAALPARLAPLIPSLGDNVSLHQLTGLAG